MYSIDIRLDAAAYSRDAVIATAHRYSHKFDSNISKTDECWLVKLASKDCIEDYELLRCEFMRAVLDDQLRETIRNRTAGLHESLIAAALSGAKPVVRNP